MNYRIELKPRAEKDLKSLSASDLSRVVERLRWLEDDLRGDVKRLSNHVPEYRMRAGDYRALLKSIEIKSSCTVSSIEGNPTAERRHEHPSANHRERRPQGVRRAAL